MSREQAQQPSRNVLHWVHMRELAPMRPRGGRLHGTPSASGLAQDAPVLPVDENPGQRLGSFAEGDLLRRCAATYCELTPPPRSTIAAAFSPDGALLASTHGDHTVKLICCRTGRCLKVLTGHRRTPWVVRFHPTIPNLLASGSLDYEVRVWDADTGQCTICHNFGRPIASLAFHAGGDYLAVASGHKLYMWEYNRPEAAPAVVLKTRRSLRAVHFQPHGVPMLLTAEVNDPSASTLLPQPFDRSAEGPPAVPRPAVAPDRPSEAISQLLGDVAAAGAAAPAGPSNLTPSIAQAQPYSAARQILDLTQRTGQRTGQQPGAPPAAQLGAAAPAAHGGRGGGSPAQAPAFCPPYAPPMHPNGQPHAQRPPPSPLADSPPSLPLGNLGTPMGQQPPINAFAGWWPWPTPQSRGPAAGEQPGPFTMPQQQQQWQPGQPGVSTLDLRSRAPRPAELAGRLGHNRPGSAAGYRRFRDGRPPVPQPMHQTPSPSRARAGRSLTPDAPQRAEQEAELDRMSQRTMSLPASQALDREAELRRMFPAEAAGPPSTPADGFAAANRPDGPEASPSVQRWWDAPQHQVQVQRLGLLSFMQNPAMATQPHPLEPLAQVPPQPWQLPLGARPQYFPPSTRDLPDFLRFYGPPEPEPHVQQQPQRQLQRRGEQEQRHWPPPRGWVDPHLMTRLYPRRDPLAVAGLPGQAIHSQGRGFGEPPNSLVDVIEQNWMGPAPASGHPAAATPGLPQPPPNPAAVASLPPSMVNMGWEYPAQLLQQSDPLLPAPARGEQPEPIAPPNRPNQADAAAVRASAAAANVIGQEQPCRVKLRLWRYSPYDSALARRPPPPPPAAAGGSAAATAAPGGSAPKEGPPAAAGVPVPDQAAQPMETDGAKPAAAPMTYAARMAAAAPGMQQGPSRQAPPKPAGSRRGAAGGSAASPAGPRGLEVAELTITDAVLCSEMGVHFSPCGRYLAACVACQGPAETPVVYEVRVYSLLRDSLGAVLAAKAIRAAHCLTSIQFSPCSEHILLAYGRRHISLLRSLVADVGASVIPVHTIMEVYRVAAGMPLVRVLPSAQDEVNAAAFHPFKGGGIAYGTKEGRLRILRHAACAPRLPGDGREARGDWRSLVDELVEADQVAAAAVAESPSSDDEA